jgi:hypothetical protein
VLVLVVIGWLVVGRCVSVAGDVADCSAGRRVQVGVRRQLVRIVVEVAAVVCFAEGVERGAVLTVVLGTTSRVVLVRPILRGIWF